MFTKQKRIGVAVAAILLAVVGPAVAEQLTTIAAFDMDQVLLSFYSDSAAIREYRTAEESYLLAFTAAQADLQELRARRATALDRNNNAQARNLANDILAQEEYLLDLQERWYSQQGELLAELQGEEFFNRLYEVVQYVAEDNGYTMVVDISHAGSDVFWYSPAIDVTEDVVQELLARFR